MQTYKRKITYFYQYHNKKIGPTAGFLKLEIRGDKVKIIINIQEPPGLPFKETSLYFYHEAGDHLAAVRVDDIESIAGVLTYQNRTDWQNVFDTGRDLYTFDGVAVIYNDDHYYIGDFQDKDRKDYPLIRKEQEEKPKENTIVYRPASFKRKEEIKEKQQVEEKAKVEPVRVPGVVKLFEAVRPREQEEETATKNDSITQNMESEVESKVQPEATVLENDNGVSENASVDIDTNNVLNENMESNDVEQNLEEELTSEEVTEPLFDKQDMYDTAQAEKSMYSKCENCPYHKKRVEQQEHVDALEKMLEEYPKLPMYGATELFDCVRIHPKDIGKLDMRNWKLGVNSFLTHGFYTYQYLLLGKMRFDDGTTRPIIGVPGVFSNREKYLANMFGFDQFISVKKTNQKTGSFGYWIVEISPYL